jgi:ferrous iron transport protein B
MQCHNPSQPGGQSSAGSIALVGHPNVGKSVIFQKLTGQRVTVSNYPGTTVEIARGAVRSMPDTVLVDTPGVITFPPQTEDEQVTGRVLLNEPLKAILQVGDAKNLRRTLWLTVQLAEMGLPMVLVVNMMDEASARGVKLDHACLSQSLSIPVIPATAVRGQGIQEIQAVLRTSQAPDLHLAYPPEIEAALEAASAHLQDAPIAPRALALLWLSGDMVTQNWLSAHLSPASLEALEGVRSDLESSLREPAALIQKTRQAAVESLASQAVLSAGKAGQGLLAHIGHLTTHPVWGMFILAAVLYSLYWFVGIFGAGTLVGLLEENLFGAWLNPWITSVVESLSPLPFLTELLVGEYGLWTMGMTYALALILPIVTTFFLAFGLMEDSGYLPRLAVLSNRLFALLGMNGKAVLPMVLGLGCVTMATLTTRVLESKRERLLVTLLLVLAVPCSAQLGVVMGMLAGISLGATMIWSGVVLLVLLAVGWLAAQVVPGERSQLMVELPPLRLPVFSNVMLKTLARLEWYLKEVVPLFLLGTLMLFLLDKSGILSWLTQAAEPLIAGWLGLPPEASAAFLIGFLRRDFGATGLFQMEAQGLLNPLQVVVAMVTITLFIPCVASVMMIAKERGWRNAIGMMVLVFPLAFLVGGLLNRVLLGVGWGG